jgi:putative ubiquitin-RnfH superfamily antitoxin RatB of RatAB toxin-antitoxin module
MRKTQRKANLPMFDMRAGFVPKTFDKEKRTVEVIFTTGSKVLRSPWFGEPYYEELEISETAMRMDRLNSGAPLLNNHSAYSLEDVIGVVESARVQDGKGIATVRLSDRPEIAGIVRDIENGIIRNISVGYMVHRFEKQNMPPGTEVADETPIYRAVDWEPMELSFVGIPADAGAQARGESAPQVRAGAPTYECELVNNTKEEKTDMGKRNADGSAVETDLPAAPSTETETQVNASAPTTEGEPAASSPAAVTEGERGAKPTIQTPEEIQAIELKRGIEIRKAVRVAGLEEKLADGYVEQKLTVEQARAAIFGELEKKSNEVRTNNNLRVEGAGMEQQIARREAATRILLNQFDSSKFATKDGDNEMRAHGILGMARKILAMEGVRNAYDMTPRELSERALHSSSDFPKVLENIANKSLQQAYEQAASTFMPFVSETSVADFKQISSVRLSDGGTLQKVNEHGEFKRGTLVETGEKYAVETYGLIIGATRKLLMNDDLGAFTKIPASLGMRAKQKENELFWAIILSNPVMAEDGNALFHASHGNLGTAAAIAIASLGEGRAKMRSLLDLDKQPINLSASYLVVPTALETVADQFVSQVTPTENGKVNPFAGRLQVIAEPRLDAGSATAWYLMSDKSKIAMVELARIDGQGPKISVREGFDIDGMETKIAYDFGMKALDYRGFFKNAGV